MTGVTIGAGVIATFWAGVGVTVLDGVTLVVVLVVLVVVLVAEVFAV
jgi:hypothetical protein